MVALCLAYRECAHAYPAHYALMLGELNAGFSPPAQTSQLAWSTFETLEAAVAAAIGHRPGGRKRVRAISDSLLAFCHGWVTLERRGHRVPNRESQAAFRKSIVQLMS